MTIKNGLIIIFIIIHFYNDKSHLENHKHITEIMSDLSIILRKNKHNMTRQRKKSVIKKKRTRRFRN